METTKQQTYERWKRVDWYPVFVIGLPFVVLSFYKSWLITFPSMLDPWYSLGYFLHLQEFVAFAPDYYVSGRLAFFLPGTLLFALLPPVAANYVFHIILYWVATISMYVVLKKTIGRATALIGTVLLGTYWHFLSEIGWNYVDGGGIAYYLLSLMMITLAADGKYRSLWMTLAGIGLAATINTNLFLLTVLPLLIIYYITLNWRQLRTRVLGDLALSFVGFSAATVTFGVVYYDMTGHFMLLGPQVAKAIELLTHKGSPVSFIGYDVPPLRDWLPGARWLRLPAAVCLASMINLCLAFKWKQFRNRYSLLFQVLFVIQCLMMAALQKHGRVLILAWYASYLIPTMFLALAAQIAIAVDGLLDYQIRELVVVAIGGLVLMLQLPQSSTIVGLCNAVFESSSYALAVLGIISVLLTAMAVLRGRWRPLQVLLVAVVCCALNAMNYAPIHQDEGYEKFKKDAYVSICQGIETIDDLRGPLQSVRFWYKPDFPEATWLYTSLNSVYLWGSTRYNMEFPQLTKEMSPGALGISGGFMVVVLSKNGGVFEEAQRALAKIGTHAVLLKEKRLQHRDVSYTVTLIKTLDREQAGAARRQGS